MKTLADSLKTKALLKENNKFAYYFGILMVIAYAGTGIYLILGTINSIPKNTKVILGIILVIYSLIRFLRLFKQVSNKDFEKK